jgi:hypothetical protein
LTVISPTCGPTGFADHHSGESIFRFSAWLFPGVDALVRQVDYDTLYSLNGVLRPEKGHKNMVFRRNKNKEVQQQAPTMRGRHTVDTESAAGIEPPQNPLARRFMEEDEPDTIDLEEPARFQEADDSEQQESTTRLLAGADAPTDSLQQEALDDPVTGFLVVISGPGRGSVSTLGYGMNSIGRESSQRVSLDFGDQRVSRHNHCLVTFDSLAGKFYIQPGEGRNLAYLDGEPVLVPTRLSSGQHIRVGDTILRFVALCGEDFSWDANLPAP